MNAADRQIQARTAWQDAQRLARRRAQHTAEALATADERRATLLATLDLLRTLDERAQSASTIAGILAAVAAQQHALDQAERDLHTLALETLQARAHAAHLLSRYLQTVCNSYRHAPLSLTEAIHVR
jgi:hypothetical protein